MEMIATGPGSSRIIGDPAQRIRFRFWPGFWPYFARCLRGIDVSSEGRPEEPPCCVDPGLDGPRSGPFLPGTDRQGILYAVSILSLFVVGLAMGDWKIRVCWRWVNPTVSTETFCFNYLGQFWARLVAARLIQSTLQLRDHAPILWGFMAEPQQEVDQRPLSSLGKFVEIGTLYTTVLTCSTSWPCMTPSKVPPTSTKIRPRQRTTPRP